jgi:transcriptional regulator with XRE-family HTH domain
VISGGFLAIAKLPLDLVIRRVDSCGVTNHGEVIRKARKSKGLTQAQLAQKVRASQPSVARWEKGGTLLVDDLAALIVALELSWSDFDQEEVAS